MRIMKDEMVNKDTVVKQQNQMKSLSTELKTTEEEFQSQQLLNLQLSNEHNTVMTDLSHILNKRNSILLECEGLKNTVTILYEQLRQAHALVDEERQEKASIAEQLLEVEKRLTAWQSADTSLKEELQSCTCCCSV